MKDVDDEILWNIVKFGLLEDIVSKERISTRFGHAVDGVLSKIRSFNSSQFDDHFKVYGGQEKISRILNLVKKMPKLDDGRLLEGWHDPDSLPQLAAIIPSLCRPYTFMDVSFSFRYRHSIFDFIKSVKSINPDYDGRKFEYVFHHNESIRLLEKYPDLKIRLAMDGSQMAEQYSHLCYELLLRTPEERLFGKKQLYPSVEHVHIRGDYDDLSDLRHFPNIKILYVYCKEMTKIRIRNILPHLKSGLHILSIRFKSWDPEDIDALGTIFNTHPLVKFELEIDEKYPERQVVDMILESPATKLKTIEMRSFKIIKGRFSVEAMGWKELFANRELLLRLLTKFKCIKYFCKWSDKDRKAGGRIKDVCRQVEIDDHRRSIKIGPLLPDF